MSTVQGPAMGSDPGTHVPEPVPRLAQEVSGESVRGSDAPREENDVRRFIAERNWAALDRIASTTPTEFMSADVRAELDRVTAGFVPNHRDVPAFTIITIAVQTENAVVTPLITSLLVEARSGIRNRLEGERSMRDRATALALIVLADSRLADLDDLLATAQELQSTLEHILDSELDAVNADTAWQMLRLGLAWAQLDRHLGMRRAFTSLMTLVPPSSSTGRLARSALGIVLDPRFWAVDSKVDEFASRGPSGDEFLDEFISRNRIYRSAAVVEALSLAHQLIRQGHLPDALRVLYATIPRTERVADWPGLVCTMIPLLITEGDIESAVELGREFVANRAGDGDPAAYWATLFAIIAWTRAGRRDLVAESMPSLEASSSSPAIAARAILADLAGDRERMRELHDELESRAREAGRGLLWACVGFLTLVRDFEDGNTAAVARSSSRFGDALGAPHLITAFEMLSNTTLDALLSGPPHPSTARVRAVVQLVRHRRTAESTVTRRADEPSSGSIHLTRREAELLLQFRAGRTNRQIAEDAFVSINTVKTQVRGLFTKLGVSSRVDALEAAVSRGLLLPESRSTEGMR